MTDTNKWLSEEEHGDCYTYEQYSEHVELLKTQLAAEREKNAGLPAVWKDDSSLESWFPLTAEELKRTKQDLAAERERNAELVGALAKYGRHLSDCKFTSYFPIHCCTCGFALAKNGGKS